MITPTFQETGLSTRSFCSPEPGSYSKENPVAVGWGQSQRPGQVLCLLEISPRDMGMSASTG